MAGAAAGVTYDQWINSSAVPAAVHSPYIGLGGVLQTLTTNAMGAVNGTAYLVLQGVHGAGNAQGRFVEAKHGGCSEPSHTHLLDLLFPDAAALGAALGVVHLCTCDSTLCPEVLSGRQAIRMHQFRVRQVVSCVEP